MKAMKSPTVLVLLGCAHPCCVAAAKEGKVGEKCNPPKKDKK